MNVADLEVCRELYELSGWDDTAYNHYIPVDFRSTEAWVRTSETYDEAYMIKYVPAFDLEYILDRLPSNWSIMWHDFDDIKTEEGVIKQGRSYAPIKWVEDGELEESFFESDLQCDRAVDTAAKLAIKLFKQGILKKA